MDEYRYSRTYTYLRQESRTPIQELEFLKYWSHYTNWQEERIRREKQLGFGHILLGRGSGSVRDHFDWNIDTAEKSSCSN